MIFATSAPPRYGKAWIFSTLDIIKSCRVVALLQPEDDRELSVSVERRDYLGDRFYQHGSFLDYLPELVDDDVLCMADADAVVQRDLSQEELATLDNLGDRVALGWNMRQGQTAEEELTSLGWRVSIEGTGHLLGVDMSRSPMYNTGLMTARVKTWKRLRSLYDLIAWMGSAISDNLCYQQMVICTLLHRHGIKIVEMPYSWHSHNHFGLTPGHAIVDKKLLYKGQPVFYAHNVKSVTH